MPALSLTAVADAIIDLWRGSPMQALLPKVYYQTAGKDAGNSYAVFTLKTEDAMSHSGGTIYHILLSVKAYTLPKEQDTEKIERKLGKLLDWSTSRPNIRGATMNGIEPRPPELGLDEERQDAQDQTLLQAAWRLYVSVTR